ncbi:MAG: glycosyltransferase family 39 protein, partial [Anaerolineae bacterium]|nr:glycosyltransferase family 39 protein [Anaerolineae bacterium]
MLHSFSTKLGKVRPVWVLAGVMLLAAALRLWQLDVLPPGLFFDEAYNGFDARQVLEGVSRPLFFAANNGREPLFIYLQALSIALLGPTPFALRVVSAMVGILTIPIMYFCAYTVLRTTPSSPQGDRRAGWLALVAAAGLAVSYWHVSLSRVGFRAILLIPVSALAIAFFWRAWTEGRTRDYVLAGIALALALYTYIAARLLPFVVAAFVLVELALSLRAYRTNRTAWWSLWKPQLAGLLILAAVMAVGILPLAWTLLSTPTLVSARTDQVSILTATRAGLFDSIPQALLSNVLATARVFYDQGDQNLRHNLPGRPANDLLLAVLFT